MNNFIRSGFVGDVPIQMGTPALLSETVYFLNKSKCKWVCIGLAPHLRFSPVVKLCGTKTSGIWFTEEEWKQLVDNQGVLLNYFNAVDTPWPPMSIGIKTIHFHTMTQNKRLIKIQDMGEKEIFLGWESVLECMELISLIEYRLDMLRNQQFYNYYNDVLKRIVATPGDFKMNLKMLLQSTKKCVNSCALKELLHFNPEKISVDCEIMQCTM